MEEKRDLRIQKTYKALFDAFLFLLGKKKFEEITVNELCDRAMVGRGTFYKHFADKYEFFSFMVKEIYQDYTRQADSGAESYDPAEYYIRLLRIGLSFMEENEALMNSLESNSMFLVLQEVTSQEIAPDIAARLKKDQQAGYVFQADPELMAHLILGALLQGGHWWFLHRGRIGKEELLRQLSALIEQIYAAARR